MDDLKRILIFNYIFECLCNEHTWTSDESEKLQLEQIAKKATEMLERVLEMLEK